MWQPSSVQWRMIWTVAVLLILAWPAEQDRSLAIKSVNWLADPMNTLPSEPASLPFALEDDADAVTAHDLQTAEYDRLYERSAVARVRLQLKNLREPFNPSTERQVLMALGVLGGLYVWQMSGRKHD